MKDDLSASLYEVMSLGDVPYRGCIIQKKQDEYHYGGQKFPSLPLAKNFIDTRFENWNKKIITNGNTEH